MKQVFKSSDFAHAEMNIDQSSLFPKLPRVQSGHWEINSFQIKQAIIFITTILSSVFAFAQGDAFTNVAIHNVHNREVLSFTAKNNVNVQHYRIEATNDNEHFHVISAITPQTNSIRPVAYKFCLSGQDYTCYRVAKVEMNGNMPYSQVVSRQITKPTLPGEKKNEPSIMQDTPIAAR